MKKILLVPAACLVLAGCVTPTVYAPASGPNAVGFSEMRLQSDRFRVTYKGGGGAPAAQVEDYALLHAADLAVANGYDWFRVERRDLFQSGYEGSSASIGIGGASFGRHSAVGVSTSTGVPLNGGPQLTAVLEVTLGKGVRPDSADAYDARDIQRTIGPRATSRP